MAWDDPVVSGQVILASWGNNVITYMKAPDYDITITKADPYIYLKDTGATTPTNYEGAIEGLEADDTLVWRIGHNSGASDDLVVYNSGDGIVFYSNGHLECTIADAGTTFANDITLSKTSGVATLEVTSGDEKAKLILDAVTGKQDHIELKINNSTKSTLVQEATYYGIYNNALSKYLAKYYDTGIVTFAQEYFQIDANGNITEIGNNSTFGLYGSGTNPQIYGDSNDYFQYTKANDSWDYYINSVLRYILDENYFIHYNGNTSEFRGIQERQTNDGTTAPQIFNYKYRTTGDAAQDNDYIGLFSNIFKNDASTAIHGFDILSQVIDVSNGTEDVTTYFKNITAGSLDTFITLDSEVNINKTLDLSDNYLKGLDMQVGITAHAGGGQADATALTSNYCEISTCATGGDSVKLPAAQVGLWCVITNHGANSCDVFPNTDDAINEAAANTAKALAANASLYCYAYSSDAWECLTMAR